MSTPSNDKPLFTEYTALSRKKRVVEKPLRDIGVEPFKRSGGTLVGEGHMRQESAFAMLGRKKTELGQRAMEKKAEKAKQADMARIGDKTVVGEKTGLNDKAGIDDGTNDYAVVADARPDTRSGASTATVLNGTQAEEQDKALDAIKPQEPSQEGSNRALQTLRPNVVRPALASRHIKAKPGAWGNSKLMKPAKDITNTAAYPTINRDDSVAKDASIAKTRPEDEKVFQGAPLQHNKKSVVKAAKRQASVDIPGSARKQPPQKKNTSVRFAAPAFTLSSTDEDEDEDDIDNDTPIVQHDQRHRSAKPATPPQTNDSPPQPIHPPLSDRVAMNQLLQLGAPPSEVLAAQSVPMARFPHPYLTSDLATMPQPQPEPQPLPKKGIAQPPQPKRARATTTTAATNKDTTPSPPPPKKTRTTRSSEAKMKVEKAAKTTKLAKATKNTEPAVIAKATSPAKKGVAAIARKKGVATKVVKKNKKKPGFFLVTDESGSDE